MSAPKCKICTKQHYGQCNPKDLPDLPQQGSSVKQSEPITNDNHSQVETPLPQKSNDFKQKEKEYCQRWRERNREKYNEYMREYRKRRREGL